MHRKLMDGNEWSANRWKISSLELLVVPAEQLSGNKYTKNAQMAKMISPLSQSEVKRWEMPTCKITIRLKIAIKSCFNLKEESTKLL